MNNIRILHLEDDDLDHEMVALYLEALGNVELSRATNEAEFLDLLENEPNIVISDYSLPSYDGMRAFAAVRKRSTELPFIMLTGAVGETKAVEILQSGVTDYILKHDAELIVNSVRRALAELESKQKREAAEREVRALNVSLQHRLEEVERLQATAEAQRAQLEVQAGRLSAALDAQRAFLLETSHELRTPLTSLIGYLHRMERDGSGGPFLPDARRVAENMKRLVGDLLEISRLEVGQEMQNHLLRLDRIVAQAGRDFNVPSVSLSGEMEIVGDPGRLAQVFSNLISNAVRVCGSPELVRLEIEALGDWAEVRVIDRGPGVPDEVKGRIFDKFYRGKEAGSAGVGLTIAQQVTLAHGGEIDVINNPEGGAIFRVRLPLVDVED